MVLFFDVRRANPAHIRHSRNNRPLCAYNLGRAIPTGRVFVEVSDGVRFYELPIIYLRTETALNRLRVGGERIAGNLDATRNPSGQVFHEGAGVIQVALADDKRGNQLCISIQCNERPHVAISAGPLGVFLLGADESPNLIHLDLLALQAAHFCVHDLLAGRAHTKAKAHDRVLVDARNALDCPNAAAFSQHGNHGHFLFKWKVVCHNVLFLALNVNGKYLVGNSYCKHNV